MVFTVTLSAASNRVVTVNYTTADSSAGVALAATAAGFGRGRVGLRSYQRHLTFLPGETSHTISVPILDDPTDEADDAFFLRLVSAVNATIADLAKAWASIVDDDPTLRSRSTIPGCTREPRRRQHGPLPRDAFRGQRADCDSHVYHVRRPGRGRLRLHRDDRHAHVSPRRDHPNDRRPGLE